MAHETGRGFFTLNPRRRPTNLLLQPALQLRLPLYLLLVTLGFALLLGAHSVLTYQRILSIVVRETAQPDYFTQLIQVQTGDFLVGSAALGLAYVLAVIVIAVVHAHRMVGPTVAFRRQIEALKNGDYSARINLRKGDAFQEVAKDLNELTGILEENGRSKKPPVR